jgi:N-acetylmuramoyl-L-alanine amidase
MLFIIEDFHKNMQKLLSIRRQSWQILMGLFIASLCVVGWWSQPAVVAQTTNVCPNDLVVPVITNKASLPVYEVTKELGVARLGPHDDCPRITPLVRGTKARVVATATGPDRFKKIVPWSQLDYGAWIESADLIPATAPLVSQISTVNTRVLAETTEISFPLTGAVPVEVAQGDRIISLIFHNTNGTIRTLNEAGNQRNWSGSIALNNPVIDRANWQQANGQVRFNFQLKPKQQWGYRIRYDGNSFVLALRQPPKITTNISQPLKNVRVVLDPGHGGNDSGAAGSANGVTYLEKTLNMQVSNLLRQELQNRGAIITMTRTTDVNPSLDERQVIINQIAPALSVSIHHDASASGRVGARGGSIYWYHPQSQNLASFLLGYYSREGQRPILNNNGVIEKSFALARPSGAPAVLLEMGFMTDAAELTELAQPATQQRLAKVLANGIQQWIVSRAIS